MDHLVTGSNRQDAVTAVPKIAIESEVAETSDAVPVEKDINNEKFMRKHYRESAKELFSGVAELPKNWDALTIREQRDWTYVHFRKKSKHIPRSLEPQMVGTLVMGDRTNLDATPEWLDREKYLRGQRFARDNLASLFFAQLLSLYTLFSFENGLKPLIVTGKSSDPYTSFKRYLSTGRRVRSWYSTDVWSRDTHANRDIRAVRKMHGKIREKLLNWSQQDIDEAAKIENPWCTARESFLLDVRESCPMTAQPFHSFMEEEQKKKLKGLNQGEMSLTQFGFIGLAILYPERFGIHGSTEQDLDAFCHLWRCLGYLLGIEDEFNFCTGTLEDVKQRSRDFLEYGFKPNLRHVTAEWEHMLRCVTVGVRFYFPSISYEQGLLYLADLLEIPMPRIRQSMGYWIWFKYHLLKCTLYWTTRIPGFPALMNRRIINAYDRALDFTDKEHEALKEKSKKALSKGIAETVAANSQKDSVVTSTYWHRTPLLVFLSTCFLIKFPNALKALAKKFLLRGDASLTF